MIQTSIAKCIFLLPHVQFCKVLSIYVSVLGILYIVAILSQFHYIYLFRRYSCFTSVKYSTNILHDSTVLETFFLVDYKNIPLAKTDFSDWLRNMRVRYLCVGNHPASSSAYSEKKKRERKKPRTFLENIMIKYIVIFR